MNKIWNEYFRQNFELNIELNLLCVLFNVSMNNQNLSPTPKVEGKGIQKLCYFGMSPFQFQKWHSPKSAAQLTRTGIVKCSKAQQNSFLFTWHKKNQSVALNGKPAVNFSHFYFC